MTHASHGLSAEDLAALEQIAKGDKKPALPASIVAKLVVRGLIAVSAGQFDITALGIEMLASAGSKPPKP